MKSQILNTKNAKGGNMKAYTIADYSNGKPKSARNAANWVTLATLLGMTDFSDAEVDSLADLQLGAWLGTLTTCNSPTPSPARITATFSNNWASRKRSYA